MKWNALLLAVACMLASSTVLAEGPDVSRISHLPGYVPGSALYDLLLFKMSPGTHDEPRIQWKRPSVNEDGSQVELYFQSDTAAGSRYAECLRWRISATRVRHGCYRWFDQSLHSIPLLTPSEAKQLGALILDSFDVEASDADLSAWDGSDDPSGALAHERHTWKLPGPVSTPAPAGPSADEQAKRALNLFANVIFNGAWPTAQYREYELRGLTSVRRTGGELLFDFTVRLRGTGVARDLSTGAIWVDAVMTVSLQNGNFGIKDMSWGDYDAFVPPGTAINVLKDLTR